MSLQNRFSCRLKTLHVCLLESPSHLLAPGPLLHCGMTHWEKTLTHVHTCTYMYAGNWLLAIVQRGCNCYDEQVLFPLAVMLLTLVSLSIWLMPEWHLNKWMPTADLQCSYSRRCDAFIIACHVTALFIDSQIPVHPRVSRWRYIYHLPACVTLLQRSMKF